MFAQMCHQKAEENNKKKTAKINTEEHNNCYENESFTSALKH